MPTLSVEVAFTAASTGTYLHLDDTARGLLGTGTLGPDELWVDVTAYVQGVSTSRGVSRAASPILTYDPGQATVVLRNDDRRFDPANLDGPYVAGGVTQVTPMRAVRVRATWNGTTYDLLRGNADSWKVAYDGPNNSTCTLRFTDGFKVLAAYERAAVAAAGGSEDTGARVSRILDSAMWPAADRVIAVGDSTLQATTLEGSALDELQDAVEAELGELYVDGAGRVVFRNRNAILNDSRSNTAQATFGDSGSELRYEAVDVDYDDATLANLVRITREGGTEQSVSDATSITQYLTHVHEQSGLLLENDTTANNYALYVLHMAKDAELRFAAITVNPRRDETNLFPQVLGREIGDRITIFRRPPGGGDPIERDVFIRGISHDITPATWRTRWVLQSATRFSFFVLDDASLGVLDENALAY